MIEFLKRREVTLTIVLVVLMAIITLRAPDFIKLDNLYDILNDSSILVIVCTGQLLVILTGGIDLSVASTLGFTGMSVALLNHAAPGLPLALIILVAAAIGFVMGSFNGLLVSVFNIPPIITTLGTLSIYRGFIVVLSGGAWVSADKMTPAFRNFPHAYPLGMTNLIAAALLVFVVFFAFLYLSRTGREVYGVGGSPLAAQYVGINVRKIRYLVYMLSGVLAGISGYLWVSRYASAQNDTATGLELQTVAACVIGGVSIAGGSGTIVGVALGSILLGVVNNALTLVHISPFWQTAIQGFVILLAIIVNSVMDRRNQEQMLRRRVL